MISNKSIHWACLTGLLMMASACGYGPTHEDGDEAVLQHQDELVSSCATATNCSNCVFYARCGQPRLPYGLFSYSDKVAIINRQIPTAGCVAVINTGDSIGHVAFVEHYNRFTGMVYISEGNWPYGRCGNRYGTRAQLNIAGYWCP